MDQELSEFEKRMMKNRIMLKATAFALAIVVGTILIGVLILQLI